MKIYPVLVRVSLAAIKHHDQKPSWGGKGLTQLTLLHCSLSLKKSGQELKQRRNLEAGADTEAMEGCCLLACSPWLAQPAFL